MFVNESFTGILWLILKNKSHKFTYKVKGVSICDSLINIPYDVLDWIIIFLSCIHWIDLDEHCLFFHFDCFQFVFHLYFHLDLALYLAIYLNIYLDLYFLSSFQSFRRMFFIIFAQSNTFTYIDLGLISLKITWTDSSIDKVVFIKYSKNFTINGIS